LTTSTSTAGGTYAITVTGVLSSTGLTTTKTFTLGVTPATIMVQVPFLTGLDNATAESRITAAGLRVGTESFDSYGLPFGTVADQSPAGRTSVELGTPVNLYVANGQG
jgi:beta-lactam-binding protein with PASTA domain